MGEVDIQEVEKKLERYRIINIKISVLQNEFENLELNPYFGAPHEESISRYGTDNAVGKGKLLYGFEEAYKEMVETFTRRAMEIQQQISKLMDEKKIIEDKIDAAPLTDLEYAYISYRYLQGQQVKEIRDIIYRCERQLQRYRSGALEKLRNIL